MTKNIQVIYRSIPEGCPSTDNFKVQTTIVELQKIILNPGEVLVRTLYLSMDPYFRGRMRDPSIESYFPALIPGCIMEGELVGQVIRSSNSKFGYGELIKAFGKWEQYTVILDPQLHPLFKKILREDNLPLSYYLGVLGMPGMTAYVGLHKICQPLTPGQTLYVSAASGAVGQVVGQYGKSLGLRVVGSAGDDAKVEYLMNELGFDAAFNYKKHDDLIAILKETCPNGIDIYFENVGGKMLDAVIINCNNHARIAVCGLISQYNLTNYDPLTTVLLILVSRIRMEGFIITEDMQTYGDDGFETFKNLLNDGTLKYRETVTSGIENAPQAFVDMLQGKNFGKALVKVVEPNLK